MEAALPHQKTQIARGEAGPWLAKRIIAQPENVVHFIYHTVVRQYFDPDSEKEFQSALDIAASRQPSNDPLRIFRWNMMERLTVQVCDCRFGLKASVVIWVARIFTGAGLRGQGSIADGLIALTRKPAARVFLQK